MNIAPLAATTIFEVREPFDNRTRRGNTLVSTKAFQRRRRVINSVLNLTESPSKLVSDRLISSRPLKGLDFDSCISRTSTSHEA